MLNDFIALFVGAYNEFMPADASCHDWLLGCLIIAIAGTVVIGCFSVVCAALVGIMKAFWKGVK